MSLPDWLRNGWLVEHKTNREEIRNLLALTDRDLADAQVPALSPDPQPSGSYLVGNTAPRSGSNHIGRDSDSSLIDKFDKFRKKRNVGGYERAGTVSEGEVGEVVALARQLREAAERWIRRTSPALL